MDIAPPLAVTLPRPATSLSGEARALLALALPMIATNLLQMAQFATDVIFVARLGPEALAASTLGVNAFIICFILVQGLVTAVSPLVASELGRRRHAVREVRRTVRMALWACAILSLPIMLLLWHGEWLMIQVGQDARVAAMAGDFLRILLFYIVPGTMALTLRTALAALGRPAWTMWVSLLAVAVNLLGNWLFVFGHLGLPAMGLRGSAIANVITALASLIAYGALFVLDRRLRRYRIFGRWWVADADRLRTLFRVGLPIALTMAFEVAVFSASAFLMGLIGIAEVAAHAIALQIASISFMVPLGIGQAATIRVGLAHGARDHAGIARAGRVALLIGIGIMVLMAALLWLLPRLFVSAYLDAGAPQNGAVVPLAVSFLGIAALFQLVDGAQVVGAGILRGLQDTRVPMLFAAFGYWVVGIGVAVALGFFTPLAGIGIWIGLATGLATVAALMLWRWSARERLGLLPGG